MTTQKQTRRNKSAKSYNQRDTMHSQTGQTGSCEDMTPEVKTLGDILEERYDLAPTEHAILIEELEKLFKQGKSEAIKQVLDWVNCLNKSRSCSNDTYYLVSELKQFLSEKEQDLPVTICPLKKEQEVGKK